RQREASTKLLANRLTSHSNGAGNVSSKSLMSKINVRSGDANTPKFARWQSPQDCTMMPAEGVFFRSWACITAVPRKKAKGDSSIRENRIGKRCFTLPSFDFSISESGSRPEGRDPAFE